MSYLVRVCNAGSLGRFGLEFFLGCSVYLVNSVISEG